MIIVKLMGGLGNQMFQYAFGRNLALLHKTILALDISAYDRQEMVTERRYELPIFNVTPDLATPEQVRSMKEKEGGVRQKIINKVTPLARVSVVHEPSEGFSDRKLKRLKKIKQGYFAGYWQSECFFREHTLRIQEDFTFASPPAGKNSTYANLISGVNAVSVHVRRGDYVHNPTVTAVHGCMPVAYYQEAVALLNDTYKDLQLFVFSDEITWAQRHLSFDNLTHYVDCNTQNAYEDMRLMSLCRHHVIANSSFSWWGAYLNSNPDKTVIAPRHWFRDSRKNASRIIPDSWLTI